MDAKNLNIAYIGGGSRGWAWVFMTDLALEPQLGGNIRLYDTDTEAAYNNVRIGSLISGSPRAAGKWTYTVSETLKDALTGADFVIISILPGTFTEMRSDVHLPERLGIFQSVGDTTGPGGIIRALRAIPMFTEFAAAIRDYAPDAWVINYTNPMALCLRALYHTFPKIKAFGCCHEVFGTQQLLADILMEKGILKSIRRNDIHINVLGLNHFTWFSKAYVQGINLKDIYRDFAREHYDSGYKPHNSPPDNVFSCSHRVKFDLFLKYGWIAAAGDRHLAEFMPGGEYLADPETVRGWGFYLTPAQWREEDLQNRLAKSERLQNRTEDPELSQSGEEGVLLIKALCGLRRVISNINIPNTSKQIENFPGQTVAETNAMFSRNDVRPVMAGAVDSGIHRLMQPHIENQDTILQAAVNCDRSGVYDAFLRDPLCAGRASEKDIKKLADDMIVNTLKFLPDGWR